MFQHFSLYSSLQLQEVEGYHHHISVMELGHLLTRMEGYVVGIRVGVCSTVSIYNLSLQNALYGWPQFTYRLFVNCLVGQKPKKGNTGCTGKH